MDMLTFSLLRGDATQSTGAADNKFGGVKGWEISKGILGFYGIRRWDINSPQVNQGSRRHGRIPGIDLSSIGLIDR